MQPLRARFAVCLALATPFFAEGAGLITKVTQLNGDTDRAPAKFTGQTFDVMNGGTTVRLGYTVPTFGENALAMTDRPHEHNGANASLPLPDYLLGREYIMIANNNRDNPSFQLDVGLSERCVVYLLVDNRLSDNNNANPPDFTTLMTWVVTDEWQPVLNGLNRTGSTELPDETGYDENGDGSINQYASVYMKVFEPGEVAFSTYQMGQGINMYGLVVDSAAPPSTPTGLAVALNGDGAVKLTWPRAKGAVAYQVKRSTTPGGPYVLVAAELRDPVYEDTGLSNGSSYYYVISGVNPFGESGDSNEVKAQPNIPVTGVAAVGSVGKVSLNWSSLAGAQTYSVKRSATSGGPYTDVGTGLTSTRFEDLTVEGGRLYYYIVMAALAGGPSGASAEVSALSGPGVPQLSVETFSTSAVRVNLSTTDRVVNSFTVEHSTDGVTFSEVGVVESPARYLILAELAPGSTHAFRARAANDSGISANSSVATGATAEAGLFINFASSAFTEGVSGFPLPGFLNDYGDEFGDRGNGYSYGWDVVNTANARLRNSVNSRDRRYDTLNHLQKPLPAGRVWEIEVPEGDYTVRIVGGDPDNVDSVFQYLVEGVLSEQAAPGNGSNFIDTTVNVTVSDGRLTLENGPAAANNKVAFVEIRPAAAELRITRASVVDGQLTVEWIGGGTLQSSPTLTSPTWQDVATGGTFRENANAPAKFFRAVR